MVLYGNGKNVIFLHGFSRGMGLRTRETTAEKGRNSTNDSQEREEGWLNGKKEKRSSAAK